MAVIDELMGHSAGHKGSPMGRVYRHTTPEMLARVVAAIEDRLAVALHMPQVCPNGFAAGRANRKEGTR